MKVGIMGGTFDPIHIGHLLLGEFAYEDFGLDEIWFVPNGNPPHKETKDSEQALRNRVEMVRLAIEHIPYFKLDLSEADTTKHSYTYFPLKSGGFSGRFLQPVRSLQQCGMTRTFLPCVDRSCI